MPQQTPDELPNQQLGALDAANLSPPLEGGTPPQDDAGRLLTESEQKWRTTQAAIVEREGSLPVPVQLAKRAGRWVLGRELGDWQHPEDEVCPHGDPFLQTRHR